MEEMPVLMKTADDWDLLLPFMDSGCITERENGDFILCVSGRIYYMDTPFNTGITGFRYMIRIHAHY